MDYELIKLGLMSLNPLMTIGVGVYTFIATRDKDNTQHIKAVETTLTQAIAMHTSRLDQMEVQMRYMPTPQQLSELQGEVMAMKATQEAIRRDMTASRAQLTRIEDFLLKK